MASEKVRVAIAKYKALLHDDPSVSLPSQYTVSVGCWAPDDNINMLLHGSLGMRGRLLGLLMHRPRYSLRIIPRGFSWGGRFLKAISLDFEEDLCPGHVQRRWEWSQRLLVLLTQAEEGRCRRLRLGTGQEVPDAHPCHEPWTLESDKFLYLILEVMALLRVVAVD
ncbi:hypothetical protein B296_00026596 [Ensete ventricosum]|uniref:Uncharacterized protein n=1 Tax=Ensete ventricosum TaxID=4639 RepID=A0A426YDH9_ENSVE|nr:hypothetical protein B296_00026596 [Ensete ventricosum]